MDILPSQTKKRVAIVTDSNSGIRQSEARELGIWVLPMPVIIDGENYYEDVSITQHEFFDRLSAGSRVCTSQPSLGVIAELWEELLAAHDEIVHIPMSSGLSRAFNSALMLSRDYFGRVYVVNNQRISVPMRQSVSDALSLAAAGCSAKQIKDYLEATKFDCSIYIMVDTLKYLVAGGRVTPAGAALGAMLRVKPILQIQGAKLDAYAKCLGAKNARNIMIKAVKKDFETRFSDCRSPQDLQLHIAYTYDLEAALSFKQEISEAFPDYSINMDSLALSIACHVGPGALGIGFSKKLPNPAN